MHEETWLVASLRAISNRFVLDGTLGCPVCHAEYRIKKGIADFTETRELAHESPEPSGPSGNREEVATRVGAFLNATEPGATLVLGGSWAEAAQELSVMTETRILALNPSKRVQESETVGLLRVSHEIPLAPASVLGVAIDASFPPEIISSALRVVRAGGRIVGPSAFGTPSDLSVLARDENYWVAEKPAELISLRRSKI
ncbi:MAG: hypothetical protein AUI63_06155 [Gemmatimonadetes bacterium 13_1_40CM_2_60_3]|nr:MAG: hypothetical protein AUI63_06155 [Gemmatimonadetes bacterium 13_1_40CM_2_60_3]